MIRDHLGVPEPTDADIRRMQDRANAWHNCPATPERLAHINELTARYYEQCFTNSWARPYLIERFHQDLAGSAFRPGYAPDGWTGLVTHLRRQGVTDPEMLAAGVATTVSTGRLIDRFRDRVVFPITHQGQILGFVGRRNPTHTDDQHGPKYLNTPDTPLFHKGAQLFAAGDPAAAVTPVLVEGPMDAIAVTIATNGTAVGLAPLGTSLTDEQAAQLGRLGGTPVIATDADPAGHAAAKRDYWILTPHGVDPLHAKLPDHADPADLVETGAHRQLATAIDTARPLAEALIDAILDGTPEVADTLDALRVVAALPPAHWATGVEEIAHRSGIPAPLLESGLVPLTHAWNADRKRLARDWASQTSHSSLDASPTRIEAPGGMAVPPEHRISSNPAPPAISPRR
jgi:DNA primase catalytic core